MLVLTRKAGEKIVIGDDVEVTVISTNGGNVKLGIRAPRTTPVHRGELVEDVKSANAASASTTDADEDTLRALLARKAG